MAQDYIKLGFKKNGSGKDLIFSDMGFLHEDQTRDQYDGEGTSSDNHITPAGSGNHLVTVKGGTAAKKHTIKITGTSTNCTIIWISNVDTALTSIGDIINNLSDGEYITDCSGTFAGSSLKWVKRNGYFLYFYFDAYPSESSYSPVRGDNTSYAVNDTISTSSQLGTIEIYFQISLSSSSSTPFTTVNEVFAAMPAIPPGQSQGAYVAADGILFFGLATIVKVAFNGASGLGFNLDGYWTISKNPYNITVLAADYTWEIDDVIVGTTAYKGQIKFLEPTYSISQSMRHIPYGIVPRAIPKPGGQVTAGMVLADSNEISDATNSWVTLYGTNNLLELLITTKADRGCIWVSPTAYSSQTADLLEFTSTINGNIATLSIYSWYNNTKYLLSTHSFDLGTTPQYADWCFVKKYGRLCIQYTARANGVESYGFFEHVITGQNSAEKNDLVISRMQKSNGQFVLSGSNTVHIKANTRDTSDYPNNYAGYFTFAFNTMSAQAGSTNAWHEITASPSSGHTDKDTYTQIPLSKSGKPVRLTIAAHGDYNLLDATASGCVEIPTTAISQSTEALLLKAHSDNWANTAYEEVYVYGYVSNNKLYLKCYSLYHINVSSQTTYYSSSWNISKLEQYYDTAS